MMKKKMKNTDNHYDEDEWNECSTFYGCEKGKGSYHILFYALQVSVIVTKMKWHYHYYCIIHNDNDNGILNKVVERAKRLVVEYLCKTHSKTAILLK